MNGNFFPGGEDEFHDTQIIFRKIAVSFILSIGDWSYREIVMGSAKQDLSRREIEIQTVDRRDAIISTIGIPSPVSTRTNEDNIPGLMP
jgi:uncharacterized protein